MLACFLKCICGVKSGGVLYFLFKLINMIILKEELLTYGFGIYSDFFLTAVILNFLIPPFIGMQVADVIRYEEKRREQAYSVTIVVINNNNNDDQ